MWLREVTWQMNFIIYIYFTKPIVIKIDSVITCEIKISTKVKLIYVWFFVFLANFDSIEKISPVKIP